MGKHAAVSADIARRIHDSFGSQPLMATLGARVLEVASGAVDIEMPYSEHITQQDGFGHAGALASIADSACGYAAMTVAPADSRTLSIEFKINLLAPAVGERFVAKGRVVRAGRSITVCVAEVLAFGADLPASGKPISLMQATMTTVPGT